MRIATIDLGTNTFLLLISELVDGDVQPVYQEEAFVCLGQGIDKTGVISKEAAARGLECLRHYRKVAADHRCEKMIACGTDRNVVSDRGLRFGMAQQALCCLTF